MRVILVLVAVSACAARQTPDRTFIEQRSHEVLAAFDRGDVPAMRAALSPAFVHFEGGKPSTRDDELERLAKRKPDEPHIASRTWTKQFVIAHPDEAVFVGAAAEVAGGNEVHGGYRFEGWYTLQWRREHGDWKLALWTWQRAGAAAEREGWNEIFRNGLGFTKEPNATLVAAVDGVTPGRALDLAMGQGRNALFLASKGWQVTGVDFSAEGIRIARENAAARNLALDAVYADVASYDVGTEKWDLVTMIYAGDDPAWVAKVKKGLRHGGLFVVEYFHDNDKPGDLDGSFARGELAALLGPDFEILRDDIVDDVPDWAMDRASLVRFVARKK